MMTSVILRTAAKLLVPLSLVFALFIYFKGHQTPGGGFVGGLIAGVAILIMRMSNGPEAMKQILPLEPRYLIATGLLLAWSTGTAALFFGLPFLASNHGYISLPGGEDTFEWATVMVFDLGVMFTVAGVVVGMIHALSEELE